MNKSLPKVNLAVALVLISALDLHATTLNPENRFNISKSSKHMDLTGPCETIRMQLKALQKWNQKIEGSLVPLPSDMNIDTGDGQTCRVHVETLLPSFVQKYLGQHTVAGPGALPNCFDSALAVSSKNWNIRTSDDFEWDIWLTSDHCEEVNRENLAPGDLIQIREVPGKGFSQHHHAAVYVSDELVFEKAGWSHRAPFAFSNMSQTLENYPQKGRCLPQERGEGAISKALHSYSCRHEYTFFRCNHFTIESFSKGIADQTIRKWLEDRDKKALALEAMTADAFLNKNKPIEEVYALHQEAREQLNIMKNVFKELAGEDYIELLSAQLYDHSPKEKSDTWKTITLILLKYEALADFLSAEMSLRTESQFQGVWQKINP